MNLLQLTGSIIERKALRYTPAGVPVSEATLSHVSDVMEAGLPRKVEFEVSLLALAETARWLECAEFGKLIEVEGFLAARSKRSRQLVMHVNTLKFVEGI